jgi:hypothetical protein
MTGATGSNRVICSTCHSAHSVTTDLLIFPAYDLATGTDPLCNACHGKDESVQNPGGTPYYHPAEDQAKLPYATSTAPSRVLDISIPPTWPVGNSGELLCMTCHRAHQAKAGTRCIRSAGTASDPKYSCNVCHLTNRDVSKENSHHLTTLDNELAVLSGRELSWYKGPGEPGDLADGLNCIDCHAKLSKSAHNW